MGNSRASTIAAPLQARIAEIDAENGSLKEKLKEARAEVERLRGIITGVRDAIKHTANSPGGMCAHIDAALNPPAKDGGE